MPAVSPAQTPAPQVATQGTLPPNSQAAIDQQREQIRKQQEVFRIVPTLADADKAEQAGDNAKARQIYLAALNVITPSPATQRIYNQAVAGLLRTNDALIEAARKAGDLATVEMLLTSSLTYDPNNRDLQAKLAQVQAYKRNPQSVTDYTNPAITDDFKKQVETVDSLFAEAEQARRTGQYDLAETKLQSILSLDPYNGTAQKKLEEIAKEKLQYTDVATEENRAKRIEEVEQKWSEPVHPQSVEAVATTASEPLTRSNEFEIAQKLKSIVIPDIEFSDTSLQNAVDFLNDKVRQLDPSHAGINFIPRPEALSQAKPITLSLKNVPLGEVLRYVTQLAQVKFKVDTSAVFFVPLTASTETLVRRNFNIPPGFFTSTAAAPDAAAAPTRRATTPDAGAANSGSLDVKDQLTQRGVEFTAEGANAVYLASSGILQVVDTQDQMDLIDELVNAQSGQTMMVDIEARFVEINQTDVNDLTFNWNLLNSGVTSPNASSAMRGSSGFSENSLASQLAIAQAANTGSLVYPSTAPVAPNGPIPSQFLLSGILNHRVYSMTLQALAQKKSADLLSAPSVRVRSGERATMDATRTFFYPTSYQAPQIITIAATGAVGGVTPPSPPAAIPAFPSAFDKQEIGVILNVQPTVGGDGRTIDLSLVPEITDFEGFINYGDPILVAGQRLVTNQILQPVFNVRRITSKVFIRDGYTVMLGGLIREDIQTINDKVPFLGDLPFVGRFFQSKANQNIKRNLLIFVTGRILKPDGELFNPSEVASENVGAGGPALQ